MRASVALSLLWIIVFGTSFFGLPLIALVDSGLTQGWASFGAAFVSAETLESLRFTVVESVASVAGAVALGLPLGVVVARVDPMLRRRLSRVLALPLLIPTVSAASAWTILIAQIGGLLGWGFGTSAIVVAHIAFNAPWIAWCVSRALAQEGLASFDLARTLGASRWQAYRAALAPRVRPALYEGALQSFAWSAMSFAVVLALGGGPPRETLEVSLYSSVRFGSIERVDAIAVALWQMILVMGAWGIGQYFSVQRTRFTSQQRSVAEQEVLRRGEGIPVSRKLRRGLWFCVLLPLAPFAWTLVGAGSLSDIGSSQASDTLAYGAWIRNSLLLGVLAASFALATAAAWVVVSTRWRGARLLAQIPAGVSPLTLGFGMWLLPNSNASYLQSIAKTSLNPAVGSVWVSALVISGLLGMLFSPIAYRILQPVGDRLRGHERWAARNLGATEAQSFWWVELRAWFRPMTSAFALAFGAAVGEVSVVMFFSHPDFVTLPAAVSRLLSQYHFGAAQATSLVVLLMGVGAFALAEGLQQPSEGGDLA